MTTHELIEAYYHAFNAGDMNAFTDLLANDVIHDINQGPRQIGKTEFVRFMDHMNRCYRERLTEIVVLTRGDAPHRAAAEFVVHGEYIATDEGLPEAAGQAYTLPAGAFFEVADGRIIRISNYYNLQDWIAQVGG